MSVRAKFVVNSVERRKHWDGTGKELQTIKMSPVSSNSEENKAFWAATPSGVLELGTVNGDAAAQFELGKSYYVDFTPAEG